MKSTDFAVQLMSKLVQTKAKCPNQDRSNSKETLIGIVSCAIIQNRNNPPLTNI